jgi:hypothetical protein
VTFECDCSFLYLQVDVAGDGSTTSQQPISKWIPNGYVTHTVLTPLHDKFYVPFLLQVVVAGSGSTTTNIKMKTKWNGYCLKLYQMKFESFDSFLQWMNKSSISNRLKDSRLFLNIPLQSYPSFKHMINPYSFHDVHTVEPC